MTPPNLLYNVVAGPGVLVRYGRSGVISGPLTRLLLVGTLPGVVVGPVIRVFAVPGRRTVPLPGFVVTLLRVHVPDLVEAAVVQRMFDLYTRDRLGTNAIAAMFNEQGLRTRTGKPWSQHAITVLLTNRIYVGEKQFRDVQVPDAHEAIVTVDQFDLAQQILGKRSTDIAKRAANPSHFMLTGLIRCPQCGRGYVGTAAHGRYAKYRSYVCWSRVPYGTANGCDIHRFNADAIEAAITTAMLDFYPHHDDVIEKAIAEFQDRHSADSSGQRDELAAVTRELKENAAAIDRYLIAFERGTIDDDDTTVRTRLAELKIQAKTLRGRAREGRHRTGTRTATRHPHRRRPRHDPHSHQGGPR